MLNKIRDLWEHLYWADVRIFNALPPANPESDDAIREFAHIIGAEETWLSRLQKRASRTPVWPDMDHAELKKIMEVTHNDYQDYLSELRKEQLSVKVTYTNSTGNRFTTSIGDILLHVALHGQYHRGKINLILRRSGHAPTPTDYIAYLRGLPTANKGKD